MFEHASGRAPEQVQPVVGLPEDAQAIQAMSWRELQVLAMRLTEDLPIARAHHDRRRGNEYGAAYHELTALPLGSVQRGGAC